MSYPPNAQEIRTVTRKVVATLTANGLSCALFGSAACALYGNSRTPNDIDIVIFGSGRTTEDLKQILARQPDFYLRPSRKVGETYKILFYKLKPSMWGDRRSCKVDILIPGIMNIPDVPHHRIVRINALPVLPIFVLLLLKLQGWSDHRASTRSDMQQKQYVDIRDINQLVAVVAQKGEKIAAQTWLPASFIQRGREHLELYLRVVRPSNVSPWREIGFDVPL